MEAQIRWKRSSNGWIAGVCSGLADEWEIQPWIVRLFFLLLCIPIWGFFLYLALAISLPSERRLDRADRPVFLNVCGQLAHKLEVETGVIRVICALLIMHSFPIGLLLYFAIYFLLPGSKGHRFVESSHNSRPNPPVRS